MLIPKNKFIETIAPIIVKEGRARGYKVVSPVIAQAICESNWGQSKLSAGYNNFFGLKCGSKWKGASVNMKTKEEYSVGTLTTIKDNFRAYSTVEEGVKGYYDFISTKRYANLKTAITPLLYCQFLKADGYATSSSYVNTLMTIIRKNGLEKYDTMTEGYVPTSAVYAENVQPRKDGIWQVVEDVIQGKYGNGNTRKKRLAEAGYDYADVQKKVNERLRGY